MYALVAALGNVIGALAVTRRAARGLAVIEHFVAFGAGFMLAVAVVELLPEAFARSGAAAPGLVLAGYLAVHLTQHTLTPHFHFGEETHAVNQLAGTSALVGLLLHTFFDGVAIASAFLVRHGLALAAGVTIYVAASNLVPEFQGKRGWKLPAAFFAGAAAFFITKTLLDRA